MTGDDSGSARSEIRQQIDALAAQLDQTLEDRKATEAAIEESRQHTQELRQKSSELASTEGRLRKEIADLESALKGLTGRA